MTSARQLSRRRPQDGYALILVLAALGVGVLVLAAGVLGQARGTAERDAATAAALQHARQALLGYAVGYRDDHPGEVFGYLPLPDLGSSRNPLVPYEGVAAGNFSGNQKNLSVIGRLPWRTLGVPPVRDGYGECLWYAVSGSHQNVQKADVVNWDSVGHFEVFASDGTPGGARRVTGADEHQRPVAVVFAAGWLLTKRTMPLMILGMRKTLPGLKNFWMAGQWVEPGGSVPVVAMSGRLAVQSICRQDGKAFQTQTVGEA